MSKDGNDLGTFPKVRAWNKLLIMCYSRNCRCKDCEYAHFAEDGSRCQVKASVLEAVRVLGIPFERSEVVISE